MDWKFWEYFNGSEQYIDDDPVEMDDKLDELTRKDMIKVAGLCLIVFLTWSGLSFSWDKVSCAYKGYTYEKPTKRPIFSECLIQMKDGSYVPLERYINRVLTFNDLGNNVEQ